MRKLFFRFDFNFLRDYKILMLKLFLKVKFFFKYMTCTNPKNEIKHRHI